MRKDGIVYGQWKEQKILNWIPVFKGTEHWFLKAWGAAGKIGSTEPKCFKEKEDNCVIFDSFLTLMLRSQVTTAVRAVTFSNMIVIVAFRECSYSGMLETEKQIEMDLEGNRKCDEEIGTVKCRQYFQFILEEE